jgi:hypothetical protein
MLGKPEQFSPEVQRMAVRGTQPTRSDRRKRPRSRVHWPIRFFGVEFGHTVETVTENLSSSGFQCFSPVPLIPGELMICVLRVPSHQTPHNRQASSLECKVRVLRVEPAEGRESFGVACQIEDYRFIEPNSIFDL